MTIFKFVIIFSVVFIEPSLVYANVYKCIVNGKTIYSDSLCTYGAAEIKVDPNQNTVDRFQPLRKNDHHQDAKSKYSDPKCQELLDSLSNNRVDPSTQSIGGMLTISAWRKQVTQEFELRCLSPSERDTAIQNRDNKSMRNKLNEIQRTQQEIQNKQRGIGY